MVLLSAIHPVQDRPPWPFLPVAKDISLSWLNYNGAVGLSGQKSWRTSVSISTVFSTKMAAQCHHSWAHQGLEHYRATSVLPVSYILVLGKSTSPSAVQDLQGPRDWDTVDLAPLPWSRFLARNSGYLVSSQISKMQKEIVIGQEKANGGVWREE